MSARFYGVIAIGVLLTSCFNPNYDRPTCGPNGECPSAMICDSQGICEPLPDTCRAFGLNCPTGQICAAIQPVCVDIGGCGDGVVEPGEVCDDGNIVDGETAGGMFIQDECSHDCTSIQTLCGNGIVDNAGSEGSIHEDCDPTISFPLPAKDTPTCDGDCTFPQCGDGHFNPNYQVTGVGPDHLEECDTGIMGVRTDSAGCDSDCTLVKCGDGHVNMAAGEECDDGNNNSNIPDRCRPNCNRPFCGDGIIDPNRGEQCDPNRAPSGCSGGKACTTVGTAVDPDGCSCI